MLLTSKYNKSIIILCKKIKYSYFNIHILKYTQRALSAQISSVQIENLLHMHTFTRRPSLQKVLFSRRPCPSYTPLHPRSPMKSGSNFHQGRALGLREAESAQVG